MKRKEGVFAVALAAIFVGVITLVALPSQSANEAQPSASSSANGAPLVFASGIAPDGLQLKMVLNATSMRPDGAIFGNVTVVNTSDQNATVPTQQSQNITSWDYYNDNCMAEYFVGYAVFSGHYTGGNISSAGTPLELVPRTATAGCPGGPFPSPITFLPGMSDREKVGMFLDPASPHDGPFPDLVNVTTDVCKDSESLVFGCLASYPGLVGYWNMSASTPTVVPFSPGKYTILAWDDWNQYAYATFVVSSNTTQ
jgi:hypothetical protein